MANAIADFSAPIRSWFESHFDAPTPVQALGWDPIRAGKSALLLAPTGSGKTLAAFLSSLDRLMTEPSSSGLRVLYVSPLKALAVDIERNLRVPIAGIRAAADELGVAVREPVVAIRSGDTSIRDRARFQRLGADLLITTPESLYLLLTSQAARHFATLETVIIDELHALLPTKRGAHLFLSLERLESIRKTSRPLQRIGLSATQRPLDEAARLLGGGDILSPDGQFVPRPVQIVDARMPPRLEVVVHAALRRGAGDATSNGSSGSPDDGTSRSAWPGIHGPLLELIRQHRSTLVFVNNRRLAERLAQALNDLAGIELVLAHHGSVAKERRAFIEEQLKTGELRGLVATSSLELGIDMGAIDLVVQVEAPPSVASGLQRIGRAGHHVGAVSNGVVFPKHKGELLTTAAVVRGMHQACVESTRFPKNPLDVLAQQIVATVSVEPMAVDALYVMCRRAAPFAELPRSAFEGVLDLLSGRYPSDEFSELRPRITWDRTGGVVSARAGAKRIAVTSGGTIADQGLYGVFLSNAEKPTRVGELDEEMVFESRVGDVFLLGASSWRIDEITYDRVLVSHAPGQIGKMPFWHGTGPGRPSELGRAIGALTRELVTQPEELTRQRLALHHGFDNDAIDALLEYVQEQREATAVVPSDSTIVIERFKDELGDYRVCLLSPYGRRVHAPWALALTERFMAETGVDINAVWADDGIVIRLPLAHDLLTAAQFLFEPEAVEAWVVRGLAKSSLFAAHFRENAGRALLLPKRDPRKRQPLWAQRRRAADLLQVASQYPSFPILLETYRECLQDVFDLPALTELFASMRRREIEVTLVESHRPSPFANTILFSYVGNFLYEADAPLAERRAHALVLDQTELRQLLGEAELRELFDLDVIVELERELLRLREPTLRHGDDVHDLLLMLGDMTEEELLIRAREPAALAGILTALVDAGRIAVAPFAGGKRYFAAEDAGKLRDALGLHLPDGLPKAFLLPVEDACMEVLSRYARTHVPFTGDAPARHFGLALDTVESALAELERKGRVVHGAFLPGGHGREWCDKNVLRTIKVRSLARLRKAIEPAPKESFARHLVEWQGAGEPSRAVDALDRVVDQLQALPIVASVLLGEVLPARVRGFSPAMLDELLATGAVTWIGVEPYTANDGKIALYRTELLAQLAPPPTLVPSDLAAQVRRELGHGGALFFSDLSRKIAGFAPDLLQALWDLVWAGEVTNDTLLPLRSLHMERKIVRGRPNPRARRPQLPGSEGRWSLVRREASVSLAEQRTARVTVLLERYGIVSREIVNAEPLASFAELYPVLRAMEEAGQLRRGFFVAELGGLQFARAGADERLRMSPAPTAPPIVLAATDPANPYGSIFPWPPSSSLLQRIPGALVVLDRGQLVAYLARTESALVLFLGPDEPDCIRLLSVVVAALKIIVGKGKRRTLLLETIDRINARQSPYAQDLISAGFAPISTGLILRATGDDIVHRTKDRD